MIYYFEGLFIYDCSSRLFDVVDESIFERYRASTKPRTHVRHAYQICSQLNQPKTHSRLGAKNHHEDSNEVTLTLHHISSSCPTPYPTPLPQSILFEPVANVIPTGIREKEK